jgi:hypothetical protein
VLAQEGEAKELILRVRDEGRPGTEVKQPNPAMTPQTRKTETRSAGGCLIESDTEQTISRAL